MEIIDYVLLENEYPNSLTTDVRNYIKKGWEPLGPAQCSITRSDYHVEKLFSQTLVKYKKEEKPEVGLSYPKE